MKFALLLSLALTLGALPPAPKIEQREILTRSYMAHVSHVHDGDTLQVRVDLGFDTFRDITIRLDGIDAPELPTPEGIRSRNFLRDLLFEKNVDIETRGKNEKYGRLLATVWFEGVNVNQLLVDKGLARPYHGERREPVQSAIQNPQSKIQ